MSFKWYQTEIYIYIYTIETIYFDRREMFPRHIKPTTFHDQAVNSIYVDYRSIETSRTTNSYTMMYLYIY